MFKKKPNIKPLAPLRSSDRRKLADQIISEFGVEIPQTRDVHEDADGKAVEAAGIGAIRNSLIPDNAMSARFTTTMGSDLKQVSGVVYAGAYPGEVQRILWFKTNDRIIPTVYTLWKNPHLVPLLHTNTFVIEKLCHGSPLMTPGLAKGPPFPSKAVKNAIVSVATTERPQVPLTVGISEIDVASLSHVEGTKGHAVRTEHWYGDELWAWSPVGGSGGIPPEVLEVGEAKTSGDNLNQGLEQLSLDEEVEDKSGGVSINPTPGSSKVPAYNEHVEGGNAEAFEKIDEKDLTTKEIDEAFWKAFLYAVYEAKRKNKDAKTYGVQFPINQSMLMSHMVMPFLPTHTKKQTAALQIKKTSWKNAKKFIKALDKAMIVKSKDRDGGECVVLDIDFDDVAITGFQPYSLPKKTDSGASKGNGDALEATAAGGSSSGDPSVGQRLSKVSLLRPKPALAPIFQAAHATMDNLYEASELRPIMNAYIDSEQLLSSTNKRLVSLDPVLANAIFDGNSSLDREVISKGTVPRDALLERIQRMSSPFYVILRNDETRETVKAKAGLGPKIQIVLETRSGNKTVSKVSGVEVFHINPQLLAEELQKTCASSTSVGQLVGSSPKNPVMEILVQGPQKESISKALEKRGISRGWIEVMDKTKGKKKG